MDQSRTVDEILLQICEDESAKVLKRQKIAHDQRYVLSLLQSIDDDMEQSNLNSVVEERMQKSASFREKLQTLRTSMTQGCVRTNMTLRSNMTQKVDERLCLLAM